MTSNRAEPRESVEVSDAAPPRTKSRPVRHRPRWSGYTAFVLSGGGARGALQVGALRALLEHGERPDVVIGTSVGAWNGAWLAMGPTLERLETMARVWESIHPAQVLLGRERVAGGSSRQAVRGALALAAARNVARDHPSLYDDAGLQQLLQRYYHGATFEEMAVPLYVIATNLTDGLRAVFSSGSLGPALLASSAIPGVFPPVRIADAVYVDGGAVENCGVELALTLGARRIFVLDVGYDASPATMLVWSAPPADPGASTLPDSSDSEEDTQPRPSSRTRRARAIRTRTMAPHALASVLERTTQVMGRYQLDRELERLPAGIEAHIIRPSTPHGGGALDFDAAPQWVAHGYAFTRAYLERGAAESPRESVRPDTQKP
jgi:NTE family protein